MADIIGKAVSLGSQIGAAKPWDELNDTEKIERMRGLIKDLQRSLSYSQSRIEKLEQLFQHDHKDGKVVIEINQRNSGLGGVVGSSLSPGQNYF